MTEMREFGDAVPGWQPRPRPDWQVAEGRFVRVELFDPGRHSEDLFAANSADARIWDYLPYGPFDDIAAYRTWAEAMAGKPDPRFYALVDLATGRAGGVASYLRIDPAMGSIEVGHINLAPVLQRTPAATEAMFLMMRWAFDAGYRRFEWKCDALNLGSMRAARRLGLSYEGTFRQAAVVKGRNRDTAWFAAIDKDWPALKAAFETWLAPENFDANGRQVRRLGDLTGPLLAAAPGMG
jgi:RimJ/RimL family protein N-acetyltransferase